MNMTVGELKDVLDMYSEEMEVNVCINIDEGHTLHKIVSHDNIDHTETGTKLGLFINLYHLTTSDILDVQKQVERNRRDR